MMTNEVVDELVVRWCCLQNWVRMVGGDGRKKKTDLRGEGV